MDLVHFAKGFSRIFKDSPAFESHSLSDTRTEDLGDRFIYKAYARRQMDWKTDMAKMHFLPESFRIIANKCYPFASLPPIGHDSSKPMLRQPTIATSTARFSKYLATFSL
jgi:hypothetical protein